MEGFVSGQLAAALLLVFALVATVDCQRPRQASSVPSVTATAVPSSAAFLGQPSSSPSSSSSSTSRVGFFAALQSIGHLFMSQSADVSYVPLKTVFTTKTVVHKESCYIPEAQAPAGFQEGKDTVVAGAAEPRLPLSASDPERDVAAVESPASVVGPDGVEYPAGDVITYKPIGKARFMGDFRARGFFGLLQNRRERSTVLVGIIRTRVYSSTVTETVSVVGFRSCEDEIFCDVCPGFTPDYSALFGGGDRIDDINPTKVSTTSADHAIDAEKGDGTTEQPPTIQLVDSSDGGGSNGVGKKPSSSSSGLSFVDRNPTAGEDKIDAAATLNGVKVNDEPETVGPVELLYVQPEKSVDVSSSVLGSPLSDSLKPKPAVGGPPSASYLSGSPTSFQSSQLNQLKQSAGLAAIPKEDVEDVKDKSSLVAQQAGEKFQIVESIDAALIQPALPERTKPFGKSGQKITPPKLAPQKDSQSASATAPALDRTDPEEEGVLLDKKEEAPAAADEKKFSLNPSELTAKEKPKESSDKAAAAQPQEPQTLPVADPQPLPQVLPTAKPSEQQQPQVLPVAPPQPKPQVLPPAKPQQKPPAASTSAKKGSAERRTQTQAQVTAGLPSKQNPFKRPTKVPAVLVPVVGGKANQEPAAMDAKKAEKAPGKIQEDVEMGLKSKDKEAGGELESPIEEAAAPLAEKPSAKPVAKTEIPQSSEDPAVTEKEESEVKKPEDQKPEDVQPIPAKSEIAAAEKSEVATEPAAKESSPTEAGLPEEPKREAPEVEVKQTEPETSS